VSENSRYIKVYKVKETDEVSIIVGTRAGQRHKSVRS
jgi:diphthamide synthase subunit DPH2